MIGGWEGDHDKEINSLNFAATVIRIDNRSMVGGVGGTKSVERVTLMITGIRLQIFNTLLECCPSFEFGRVENFGSVITGTAARTGDYERQEWVRRWCGQNGWAVCCCMRSAAGIQGETMVNPLLVS